MEIVKGKAGNALTSVAPDHVIAVAADIYDEKVGEYQENINNRVADRTAVIADGNVQSLGYKILKKEVSFAQQIQGLTNTIFEVRYNFDLGGGKFTIPEYCTLNFVGGKITKGTIVGNKTNLTGNISVDKIEGSFACEIKSTYSTALADYPKLKMLLGLTIDTLILDEDFYVAEDEEYTSRLNSSIPVIKGSDITINVDTIFEDGGGDFYFANFKEIKIFEGVCFDFKADIEDFNDRKGKTRGVGIVTSPIATVRDVTIKNIKGSNVVNALSITCNKEEATILKAENITLSNLSTIGDKTIGNSDGYLYAFNLSINKDNSHILLKNITFNNIVAWDKDGNYNSGDAGSFYVHVDGATDTDDSVSANRSNVVFDGINAVNPGYRLIKTDCKFVTVKNVIAKRTTEGEKSSTMTLIGFNNGDGAISDGYAIVDNVHFEGDANVIISVALPDGEVSNVTAKLKNFSTASSLLSAYNRLAVKNCTFINGGVLCQGPQNEATAKPLDIRMENITVDRTDNEWSSFCMFNSYTSNKLEISNFRINNYLLTNEYKNFPSRVGVSEYIFRNIYITNNINNGSWIFSFSNKTNLTLLNTCFKGYARGLFGLNNCTRLLVDELEYDILGTTMSVIATYGQIYLTNKDGYYCLKNVKGSVAQSPREWSPSFQSKVVENEETVPVEFKFHNVDFRTPVIVKDRYIYWTTEYVRAGDPSTLADQYGYLPQIDGVKTTIEVKGIGRVNCEYRYGGWNIVDGVADTISKLKNNNIPFANGTSVYVKDLGKPVWWSGESWVDGTGFAL